MGPNDPFGARAPQPTTYRVPPASTSTAKPTATTPARVLALELGLDDIPRAYLVVGVIGMAIGLSTWVIGWVGTLVVFSYGVAAIVVFALVQWARRHLDVSAAVRALLRKS